MARDHILGLIYVPRFKILKSGDFHNNDVLLQESAFKCFVLDRVSYCHARLLWMPFPPWTEFLGLGFSLLRTWESFRKYPNNLQPEKLEYVYKKKLLHFSSINPCFCRYLSRYLVMLCVAGFMFDRDFHFSWYHLSDVSIPAGFTYHATTSILRPKIIPVWTWYTLQALRVIYY